MKILAGVQPPTPAPFSWTASRSASHGQGRRAARHRPHPPGTEPGREPRRRRQHLPGPRADCAGLAAPASIRPSTRAPSAITAPARPGRARRARWSATCSVGQQQLVEIARALSLRVARAHPRRADLQPDRTRDRPALRGHRRPEAGRHQRRLHLAPAQGGRRDRRPRHRAARRPQRRRTAARRASATTPSCG